MKFFKDVFGFQLMGMLGIFFIIVNFLQGDNKVIPRYFLLLILLIISIKYLISSSHHKLDRKNDIDKVSLTVRALVSRFCVLVIYRCLKILFSLFNIKIDVNLQEVITLLLSYSLLFSVMAIVIGVKTGTLILIMVALFPVLIVIGAFDIKWWALITGFLMLWNYINSEDFLYYLRKGKGLAEVPKELRYQWTTNKLVIYLTTFLFYVSLIISSFFEEKKPNELIDYLNNAKIRVYSLLGTLTILFIISFIIFYYFYLLNSGKKLSKISKLILNIGNRIGLNTFNKSIKLYMKAKKGEIK